jgi:hypothetical protein
MRDAVFRAVFDLSHGVPVDLRESRVLVAPRVFRAKGEEIFSAGSEHPPDLGDNRRMPGVSVCEMT